ncbi:hypothetical protein L207DRAFT_187109 [Hyaloscypha variabilis F]|uniref:Uncharacterized protein n=1 Tax=Hyaloscypha variabilis (strain UAMH 11265 / GT02V1 / F) TaxID=1149755 RepID=A0A2J6QZZ0_HYAVF|nr:hypothetical protein L207DRAFT_187109 [Hyaloscypha variabilis F]
MRGEVAAAQAGASVFQGTRWRVCTAIDSAPRQSGSSYHNQNGALINPSSLHSLSNSMPCILSARDSMSNVKSAARLGESSSGGTAAVERGRWRSMITGQVSRSFTGG